MHEASVARSILDAVLTTALKDEAREVLRVELEVGEICLVNVDQLTQLINLFAHDTIAKDMRTSVSEVRTEIRCHNCSYVGGVNYREVDPSWHYEVPIFDCVRCKSSQTEIIRGRELTVKAIDVSY